jgi:TPR repeat protein
MTNDPLEMSWDAAGYYKRSLGDVENANVHRVTAYTLWLASATQGDGVAQCNLGMLLERGHGCTQDSSEAVTWFLKAAEQGISQAEFNLGIAYLKGRGVSQDQGKAFEWFKLAADHMNQEAQYTMGVISMEKGDIASALYYYNLAVEKRDKPHPLAAYNLGLVYAVGLLSSDKRKAADYFGIAAEQQVPQAQHNLAYYLEQGVYDDDGNEIIAKDEPRAFGLYLAAAEQGHADSQYSVALCYDKEIGVIDAEKERKSCEWLMKAAKQSHPGALYCMGIVNAVGSAAAGIDANQINATNLLMKAKELGCDEAAISLVCPSCQIPIACDDGAVQSYGCAHRYHRSCNASHQCRVCDRLNM